MTTYYRSIFMYCKHLSQENLLESNILHKKLTCMLSKTLIKHNIQQLITFILKLSIDV